MEKIVYVFDNNYVDLNNLNVGELRKLVKECSDTQNVKEMSKTNCIMFLITHYDKEHRFHLDGGKMKPERVERLNEKCRWWKHNDFEGTITYYTSEEQMYKEKGYKFNDQDCMEVNLDFEDVLDGYYDFLVDLGLDGFIHNNVNVWIDLEKTDKEIEVLDEEVVNEQVMLELNVSYNEVKNIVDKLSDNFSSVSIEEGRKELKEYCTSVVREYVENIEEHMKEYL